VNFSVTDRMDEKNFENPKFGVMVPDFGFLKSDELRLPKAHLWYV